MLMRKHCSDQIIWGCSWPYRKSGSFAMLDGGRTRNVLFSSRFRGSLSTSIRYQRQSSWANKNSAQRNFQQNVKSLTETLSDLGNPYTEQSEDLFSLVHKVIADVSVVPTVREDERTGQDMYAAFVEVRFIKRQKKVFDPIKKNSISLFRTLITKVAQQESQS